MEIRLKWPALRLLLPVYRKELRIVFLEYLKWMHAMKKDSTFRKVMQTRQDLKDSEGYDWLESTELAVDKRKFLLDQSIVCQTTRSRKLSEPCLCTVLLTHLIVALLSINLFEKRSAVDVFLCHKILPET